jgi:hypothetical protein
MANLIIVCEGLLIRSFIDGLNGAPAAGNDLQTDSRLG